MQDPTLYLNEIGVSVPSIMDSSRPATIDTACLVSLNYETFLFADAAERKRFLKEPSEYSGPLTDPVTLERFTPIPTSPHIVYENRTYYFWSDSTRTAFEMMPEMYSAPHHKMRPAADSAKG